jgi:hypothetical protein
MAPDTPREPGLDLFWEEADRDAAADHPLERELAHRIDALVRCEQLMDQAAAAASDSAMAQLESQHRRQREIVDALARALKRSPP